MAAQKQPFTTWKAADLGVTLPAGRRSKAQKLFIPERKVNCEIIPGKTPEEAGANLAVKFREIK
jgi:electron transfer flavoprotein alpha/beta subunit